jgi:heme-degrading monooxygenase HmoA
MPVEFDWLKMEYINAQPNKEDKFKEKFYRVIKSKIDGAKSNSSQKCRFILEGHESLTDWECNKLENAGFEVDLMNISGSDHVYELSWEEKD